MPGTSTETLAQSDLRTILLAALQTAPLAAGLPAMTAVVVSEVPTLTEVFDTLPRCLICPRGPDPQQGLSFEGGICRTNVEEVIIIAGREGDMQSEQPTAQWWKEVAVNAVERNDNGSWRLTLPNSPGVFDIRVGDVKGIDRTKLSSNYAYLSFFVKVSSSE